MVDGSKGKGKGIDSEGNVYILQAPKGPGSEIIYPLGKGGGNTKEARANLWRKTWSREAIPRARLDHHLHNEGGQHGD